VGWEQQQSPLAQSQDTKPAFFLRFQLLYFPWIASMGRQETNRFGIQRNVLYPALLSRRFQLADGGDGPDFIHQCHGEMDYCKWGRIIEQLKKKMDSMEYHHSFSMEIWETGCRMPSGNCMIRGLKVPLGSLKAPFLEKGGKVEELVRFCKISTFGLVFGRSTNPESCKVRLFSERKFWSENTSMRWDRMDSEYDSGPGPFRMRAL